MKAILVIDVDEKSIGREVNYIRVQGNGYSYIVKAVGENVRLRPLPKEEESADEVVELGSYNEGYGNGYECGFTDGWNACLKEIQK